MSHPRTVPKEFTSAAPRAAEPSSASIHHIASPPKHGQPRITVSSPQIPRTLRTEVEIVALPADLDGLPSPVRSTTKVRFVKVVEVLFNDAGSVSEETVVHSVLLSALEEMVDRMRGAFPRSDHPSKQPLAIAELNSSIESSIRPPAESRETMLRVGSLELDLVDRTARRGGRPIDLGPCEFRLLKYMMQRADQLLTRATLLRDVWRYNFVPATNLVDVHMGRLRRKVDGSNEAPMIRNVRGAGFILSAAS
jgi:Transcriptional regulatory protein, C terminal